jgi:glycosyltransferase involved in cell wall biosynthesis
MQPKCLDVVIPARAEVNNLAEVAKCLLPGSQGIRLKVIVVLNGEDQDSMKQALQGIEQDFRSHGHCLQVYSIKQGSKTAALNLGDMHRRAAVPVVYLDADCRLSPGTLQALVDALDCDPPIMAGPHMTPIAPRSRTACSYLAVWKKLPLVHGHLLGAGCFAVNPAGRARWNQFPVDMPDDAYVRSHFSMHERKIVENAVAFFSFPEAAVLPATIKRWAHGNCKLRRNGRSLNGPNETIAKSWLLWLLRNPTLWRHLPAFLFIQFKSYLHRAENEQHPSTSWRPIRSTDPDRRLSDCSLTDRKSRTPTLFS